MNKLSEIIRKKHNLDFSQEIASQIFEEESFLKRISKTKRLTNNDLYKIEVMQQVINLGEY